MMARPLAWALYAVFLLVFGAYKYFAAAPAEFSMAYAVSVAILVVLTGVVPFVAALFLASRASEGAVALLIAVFVGLVTCCAGYAAYWALFIQPSGADVPVIAVALRGVYAGPIEGLLATSILMSRRKDQFSPA